MKQTHFIVINKIFREIPGNVNKNKLLKVSFQQLLHRDVGEGATPFPGFLHFTLDTYLILLSVKQGSIKYHF